MIDGLKPYPEYKESGLPWLGQMPRHWGLKRGKSIFERIDKRSKAGKEELLTVSSAHGVVPRRSAKVTMFKAESYKGYKLCWPGDLVINSLWAWGGGLGVSQHHGIISSAYGVYRLRRDAPAAPGFIHEIVRSSPFNWELQVRSKGIWTSRLQLTDESFLDAPFHLPPPDEQTAIVRFLDHANARIERAIRAKKKLIALLNEQKQAIIHRAVTRGLDPTVPLKPSGIRWLGDIPKHWEVCQLRRLIKYGTSITYGIVQAGPDIEGGIPYIRTSDMKGQVLPRTGYLRTSRAIDSSYKRSKVESGDLVVAIRATLGKGLVVPDYLTGANLTQGTAKISPGERLSSQFLCAAFNSKYCQESIRMVAKGTTFLEITLGDLREIPLAIPPKDEQAIISARLADDLNPLNTALSRAEREIALLREYRTRLTADVVTGKLDVRGAACHLPEAFVEPQPADEADDLPEPEPEEIEA